MEDQEEDYKPCGSVTQILPWKGGDARFYMSFCSQWSKNFPSAAYPTTIKCKVREWEFRRLSRQCLAHGLMVREHQKVGNAGSTHLGKGDKGAITWVSHSWGCYLTTGLLGKKVGGLSSSFSSCSLSSILIPTCRGSYTQHFGPCSSYTWVILFSCTAVLPDENSSTEHS